MTHMFTFSILMLGDRHTDKGRGNKSNHPHIRHRLLKKGPKLIKKKRKVEEIISFSVNVFFNLYSWKIQLGKIIIGSCKFSYS